MNVGPNVHSRDTYYDCDNCGMWGALRADTSVYSLDALGFCSEACLDTYLTGGNGVLSPNPQDTYNPEPYLTSFYVHDGRNYILKRVGIPCQFFTTDQGLVHGTWFPMDHFFFAPSIHNRKGGFVEENVIVHLEGHSNVNHPNGFSVSVIQGWGDKAKAEEFDDYPSALRRMADIIEEYSKKK